MELFKELTQLHGVSGYEREVRTFIKECKTMPMKLLKMRLEI